VYGGLGRHVHAIAEAQAAAGHEVTVISQYVADEPSDVTRNGVRIVRAINQPPHVPFEEWSLLGWVLGMEHALLRQMLLVAPKGGFDVVHAHDWVVAHTAVTLADVYKIPLVTTMHATEAGRHQGWLPGPLQRAVHSTERWLTEQSVRVITCSKHMAWEVEELFGVDDSHIDTIPNGIDLTMWKARPRDIKQARQTWAADGPLVVFTGRLQWEKGIHTLIEALPTLKRRVPGLRVVIAGRGTYENELRDQAKKLRLGKTLAFTGYLTHEELTGLVAAADVAVVPSLYEPFGLVALEAAALGTNVVVSRAGGLAEIANSGITQLSFEPGDSEDLAAAIEEGLTSTAVPAKARRLLREEYSWQGIARRTVELYAKAKKEKRPVAQSSLGHWDHEERTGNLLRPDAI
jgi:glycogen(starch) synthase